MKKRETLKFIFFDIISSSSSWVLFFMFRKKLENQNFEIFNVSLQKRNDIKLAETNLAIAHKEQKISESYLLPSATAYYSYNSRVIMNGTSSLKSQFDLIQAPNLLMDTRKHNDLKLKVYLSF